MEKKEYIDLIKLGIDANKKAFKTIEECDFENYSLETLQKIFELLGIVTDKYIIKLLETIMEEEKIEYEKPKAKIIKLEFDKKGKTDKQIRKEIKEELQKHLPEDILKDILKCL